MSTLLKPIGCYWKDLCKAEQDEIISQMPKIQIDPNFYKYRFYKSQQYKWIICNVWTVPMKTNKSIWT